MLAGNHSLAILDQVVVSGTRFLTSIIVGRTCGPHELGDYTLGFTLFCVGGCIQTALISQPYTIYGNYLPRDERRAYSGSVLAHFAVFELLVMILFGLAAGALILGIGRPGLAPLAGVLAVTFPLAFVVEFARRFAQARLEMRAALATDVVMSVVQVGGLVLLAAVGQLSAETTFVAMGLGGAVAGLTWLALARRRFVVKRGASCRTPCATGGSAAGRWRASSCWWPGPPPWCGSWRSCSTPPRPAFTWPVTRWCGCRPPC